MNTASTNTHEQHDTIRILHVDDDPNLADLTTTFLTREDDRFKIETAHTVSDGLDHLAETDFDCIVSDYDMPGRNGIEFLKAVREEYPDLPFILFTGKGSEEVASDAIFAGVSDYLQKRSGTEQYQLLANRILSAVTEYQAQQFERVAKHDPMTLLNRIFDGFLSLDTEWRFTYVNEKAQSAFGKSAEELLGESVWESFPEIRDTPFYDQYQQAMEENEPRTIEAYLEPWNRWYKQHIYPSEDGLSVLFRDITDQKKHEQELQRKERRYQAVFNDPNILVGLLDTDGTVLDINQTAMEFIDASLDDVTDTPFWKAPWFDHSKTVQNDVQDWIERAASGEYVDFEVDLVRPSGEQYTVTGVFRPVANDDGEVVSLLISTQDISEHKDRERELERMARRLDAILDNTMTPMFMKDDEGRYIFVNRGYRELFEFGDEDIVGRTAHEIHPPEMAEEVRGNDREVLERDEVIETEDRITVNGEQRIFLSTKVPIYDTGDRSDPEQPVAVFGVASDITELKEQARELHETKQRLELVLGGTETGIWEWTIGTDEINWNDTLEQAVGLEPGSFEGTYEAFAKRVHPDDLPQVEAALNRAIETDELYDMEFRMIHENGDTVWAECPAVIIEEEDRPDRMIGLHHEITERKRREEQLEMFASIVSHDLRNPLSVASGFLELAQEEYESNHLDYVAEAHERMDELIEELLTLAREGYTESNLESVDLPSLTESCWENVPTAEATLMTDIDEEIRADRSRLQQLLENLIRNAVEHGGEDVTVTVGTVESGFYVEDDGPGIPEDKRNDLFEIGYSTREDGTGFGLSIVKHVANEHDWEIRVTDGSKGGARFEVTNVEFAP